MAVAVRSPVMGAEDRADRSMHPFFASAKDRTNFNPLLEPASSTQPNGEEVSQPNPVNYEQFAPLQDNDKRPRQGRKRAVEEQSAGTADLTQSKLSFGGPSRSSTSSEQGNDGEALLEAPQIELHEEQEIPRKRRKTCSPAPVATTVSPEHPLGWEEQLLQAGFAGSSSPVRGPPISEKDEAVEETSMKDNPLEGKEDTPPTKIIRLRTDGRLVSPKTKQAEDTKNTRKPRKSREKIVILHYGCGNTSRTEIGEKIDDVFCGRYRLPKPEAKPHPPKQAKPSGPPKPTHPFFTGGVARTKPMLTVPHAHEDSDTAASTRERSASPPRKAKPTAPSWDSLRASFTKQPKLPGTSPAPWPPFEMQHVRGSLDERALTYSASFEFPQRRLKGAEARLNALEDVLNPLRAACRSPTAATISRAFHKPRRRLMTGKDLQATIAKSLKSTPLRNVSLGADQQSSQDELALPGQQEIVPPHPAVLDLFRRLPTSFGAFDKFECEQHQWTNVYAPKSVSEVLHHSKDLLLLRDWLFGLTVNSVNSSAPDSTEKRDALAKKLKAKRKKRKATDELDDFIVSSEEDTDPEDDLEEVESAISSYDSSLRRLSPRNIAKTRAVVLSGPPGSGKTACVYAAASELGFEIFEINSGLRRSGRDIMDKVGDMTRNHLVRQTHGEIEDSIDGDDAAPIDAQAEVDSGRQSTMNSFFKSKLQATKLKAQKKAKKDPEPIAPSKKPSKKQKQSLVLLEEVDVLFEQDKHFWTTVISLLVDSRRPVILTCTDESLLPTEEMIDVAMLRLSSVPEALAVDHLILLAANEGHILSRDTVRKLYKAQNYDLRAAIMQLSFVCQMALGDTKGGLEWMLIRSNHEESHNSNGEPLRVISEGTIVDDMPLALPDSISGTANPRAQLDEDLYTLLDSHTNWELDPGDWLAQISANDMPPPSIDSLRRLELATDALSASDIMPGSSLLDPSTARLDSTHPPLSEKDRLSYPEGYPLLDTPLQQDPTNISLSIVLSLKLLARPFLASTPAPALTPSTLVPLIFNQLPSLSTLTQSHSTTLSAALSPLSIPPASTVFSNSSYRPSTSLLPSIKSSILATDIAPFVRSIAASDLVLEQERVRLSGLLSQGGRDGKRARTTRAARAALEGGKKESTRKERWFGREVNYRDVLRTAGVGWAEARLREVERTTEKMLVHE